MARVCDLEPGDRVALSAGSPVAGIFITRAPHPYYPGLMLVIWWLSNGTWSYDALHPEQVVGEPEELTDRKKGQNVMNAMNARMMPYG